ncbi:leupaxin [Mucor ambiguus]|uniref:Leupaxin n=1 Tax=Mucor ambiguus TaxID=91626 RepID=A0A0C9MJN9_9FUNG|nr:leupaxin [Mucor ambiguus]
MQSDVCYDYYNSNQSNANHGGHQSLRGPRPIQQPSKHPYSYTPRQPRKPIEVRVPAPRTQFVPQPPLQPYVYPAPKPQLERKPSKTELPLDNFTPPSPAPCSSTKTIAHSNPTIRRKPTPPIPAPKASTSKPVKPVYQSSLSHYSSDEDNDDDDMNDEDILRDLTLSRRMSVHDITISSDEEDDDDDDDYSLEDTSRRPTSKSPDDLPPIPQISAPGYSDDDVDDDKNTTSASRYTTRKNDLPPIPSIFAPGYSDDDVEKEENSHKSKAPLPVIPTICVPGGFSDDEDDHQYDTTHAQQKKKSALYNSMYFGIRCGGCEEPLSGQAITTSGKHWHPRCFKCQACHQNLEHIAFYEKDSLPYCALDYHELFSPRCDFCKTPIEEHSISALGKTYHAGHFFCRECGKPFDEETNFLEHGGHAYCEADYYKQFGKACKGCEEMITGDFLVALGGEWHKECFVCADCGSTFASSTFLIKGGKPYCEEHYHQQTSLKKKISLPKAKPLKPLPSLDLLASSNSSKSVPGTICATEDILESQTKTCHKCQTTIQGRCHSAFGHDYHPLHFQCSRCNKLLSARLTGLYQEIDDGPAF